MNIIKTGINITKALRNISRLREIVLIFARNGFDEFISMDITSKIPDFVLPKPRRRIKEELAESKRKDWHGIIGRRLRKCFEELGPAFVKFGQFLSTREDIFDESFTKEMAILRDRVQAVPFEEVRTVIEGSLGQKIEDIFSSFDEEPIGTASIGLVYKGSLKKGEQIVVKVKRPRIDKVIETDFSIVMFLISRAEKISEDIRLLGLSKPIKEFSASINQELNFYMERANCQRFRENVEKHDFKKIIYIPKIYDEYSTDKVLIMEYIDGIPLNGSTILKNGKEDLKRLFDEGLKIFIKTFLRDGFFHADLHGGNIFFLEGNKLGIIDYGFMGTLSRKQRQALVVIIYSLLSANYEKLVHEFLDVAQYQNIPDVEGLIDDIKEAILPFVGLSAQQTDYVALLKACVGCLKKHEIYLPSEWFVVLRSLMALDGLGRVLEHDVDLFKFMGGDIEDLVLSSLSKKDILEEGLWMGRDILSSMRILPLHFKWFVRTWAKNGYALEVRHENLDKSAFILAQAIHFLGFIFLSGIFILSGVLLFGGGTISTLGEIPAISWVFWLLGLVAFLGAFFKKPRLPL